MGHYETVCQTCYAVLSNPAYDRYTEITSTCPREDCPYHPPSPAPTEQNRPWRGKWRIKPKQSSQFKKSTPEPVICSHSYRTVWDDYYSTCSECVLCGHSTFREY